MFLILELLMIGGYEIQELEDQPRRSDALHPRPEVSFLIHREIPHLIQ